VHCKFVSASALTDEVCGPQTNDLPAHNVADLRVVPRRRHPLEEGPEASVVPDATATRHNVRKLVVARDDSVAVVEVRAALR
jgi:hypothetical protein